MLTGGEFYALLEDPQHGFLEDSVEGNFRRYQNEIEYGAWNRNEDGGIVEGDGPAFAGRKIFPCAVHFQNGAIMIK